MQAFLRAQFSDDVFLFSEAPRVAPQNYWPVNDGILAAAVLRDSSPATARKAYTRLFGLGLIGNNLAEVMVGETIPWPPLNANFVTLETGPGFEVLFEERAGGVFTSWANFADQLAYRALTLALEGDEAAANAVFDQMIAMWDGTGFADQAFLDSGVYTTFKNAYALTVARSLNRTLPFEQDLIDRLGQMQDRGTGGIITGYLPNGDALGDMNTETTAWTLIALEGPAPETMNFLPNAAFEVEGDPAFPADWFRSANGVAWSTDSRSGSRAIELNDQSAGSGADYRSPSIAFGDATRLLFSFHSKRPQASSGGAYEAAIRFFQGPGTNGFLGQRVVQLTDATSGYQRSFIPDVPIPDGATNFDVVFRTDDATTGRWIVDDVYVTALPDPSGEDPFCLEEANSVANGGAESEIDATGLPTFWFSTPTGASRSDAEAVTGTHSFEINDQDLFGAVDFRSAEFDIVPDRDIAFAAYSKYIGIIGNFGLFLRYIDAAGSIIGQDSILLDGTLFDWAYQERRFTPPAGAVRADVFLFTNDTFNTGLMYVDDITVDQNLVLNGRLEAGAGNVTNDWFASPGVTRVNDPDAPSRFFVLRLDDQSDAASEDLRCKPFSVAGLDRLDWGIRVRRTDIQSGFPIALLRFWEDVTPDGTGGVSFLAQEAINMPGDTDGFECLSRRGIEVPAGAGFADVVVATFNDLAVTGTVDVDNVVVTPTPPCRIDLNGDGVGDFFDLALFAGLIAAADPSADFDQDGDVDVDDAEAFLRALPQGCD